MSEEKLKYWIKANEHVYTIRELYDDDDWDAGETGLDVSLEAISCSEHSWWSRFDDDGYDCIYGVDDIPVGDYAHIVLVEYTTGSTFGSHGAWTIAAIKKDPLEALMALERCQKDDPDHIYRSWEGYFEYLNSVSIVTLVVIP